MKMPQRWRTSRDVHFIILLSDWHHLGMSCDIMMSYHDVTWRHDITEQVKISHGECRAFYILFQPQKSRFLFLWPWPLTYDLDHQTRLRLYQGQSLYQLYCQYIKRFGCDSANEQTDRKMERQKDTQKHGNTGPILLPRPLTREVIRGFHQTDMHVNNSKPPLEIVKCNYFSIWKIIHQYGHFDRQFKELTPMYMRKK